ncbi:MAG: sodium/glutamate symporter [Eubacterium aggregans]|uniref:sodium/glutamate symporter n=1 Tax=Eubacterium aggregans TaxID=81409 RepID=UPI002B217281|nr:sodium/glutamate symporter [Eubacterium aggregans]MEA5073268.1 sodium/glutamate symporter [Eubacterium aggregans]
MIITLDMIQTLAVAAVVLYLGEFLRKHIPILARFCIPAPVVGGLLFSLVTLLGYTTDLFQISFDLTLQEVCMTAFFTSIGFGASFKSLRHGGLPLVLFVILVIGLILLQNLVALGMSYVVGVSPLLALCTGSIPMVGGHGSAGAFGPMLKAAGVDGATSIAMAAATFGLVAGSLLGGPLGKRLIDTFNLTQGLEERHVILDTEVEVEGDTPSILAGNLTRGICQLAIAMGIGTLISWAIAQSGLNFPSYIGAMIAASILRNISDGTGAFPVYDFEIAEVGEATLSLFLAMALMSLQLWQLAALAIPLILMLTAQVLLMTLFARFVVFPLMGRDYDAAIITAGTCGFGMGATPNAMANMQALTEKYLPSEKAFLIIPIAGALFVDFFNSIIVTFFINLLS